MCITLKQWVIRNVSLFKINQTAWIQATVIGNQLLLVILPKEEWRIPLEILIFLEKGLAKKTLNAKKLVLTFKVCLSTFVQMKAGLPWFMFHL